jgi:hypothetical protein
MFLSASKSWLLHSAVCVFLLVAVLGCPKDPSTSVNAVTLGPAVVAIDLSSPTQPVNLSDKIRVSSAKNADCSFTMRLDSSQFPARPALHFAPFAMADHRAGSGLTLSAYQVLSAPVNLDDAAYVRQTGQSATQANVPRVLLPLPITKDGVDLTAARDPLHPAQSHVGNQSGPILIWIDIHIAAQTPPGEYTSRCDLVDNRPNQNQPGPSIGNLTVQLLVDNLTLPIEPHLHFSAPLEWDALAGIYPDLFQLTTPRLLNRSGEEHRAAVLKKIDSYLQLAHENKADFYVTRLQPIVKWPLGRLPEADWTDFDAVVLPWMNGSAFSDHRPVAFWPLPTPDSLAGFDLASRIQYWQVAAEHFYQANWLERCPVMLNSEVPGRINEAESLLLCAEARQILATNPRVITLLPLHDDQTDLASDGNPNGINPDTTARLLTAAPGLVCLSPMRDWPASALPPRHWIDAIARDGSCDITGIACEQGLRTLAATAFTRDASLILCGNPLPGRTNAPARADQLIWCYPGEAFGVDYPLATLQLKWMRQAEQDYEYLLLASQQKDHASVLKMAQLIAKPVQLQPGQHNQPIFNLLAGNSDPHASEEARQLLVARLTATRSISAQTDPAQLQTLRWFAQRQQPRLVATAVQWMWNLEPGASAQDAGHWIDALVGVDIYNPAEEMPSGNTLQWTNTAGGWETHPDVLDIPSLAQYQVHQVTTHARFNLDKITADSRQPLQLSFVDGFTGQTVPCKLSLPIAKSERRKLPLNLDGELDDWFAADAIQLDEPLIRMMNRPALQSSELEPADSLASIYTSWSDDNFYLAFRLGDVTATDLHSTRNFVKYDHGRAWGEDLCEILIQPIYLDNTLGPTMHVVCKPAGNWVEQQAASSTSIMPWQDFEASGLRYASGVDPKQKIWRGEIAIPWKALAAKGRGRPALLRFNFIQHQQSNAQSASWAGPIDESRDGSLAGLLMLKEQ